ncbi:MAG: hypothetical protein KIT33_10410 [Candidatus Kapabacteria bacterium]|nr:hypothetical protein [Ignavibacteriota bacterium]MCW5885371.1 hypothetical protein [Candidatus Kapabacteria bacterium]
MKIQILGQILKRLEVKDLSDDELLNLIGKTLNSKFEINHDNKVVFQELKYYFTNDDKFNHDLKKGLLINGGYGTGKTMALDIFQIFTIKRNLRNTFEMFDSDTVIDEFTKTGRPSIENFNKEANIGIDDLGEDSGKHYHFGTVEDPIDVLLSRRYRMFTSYGYKTFATSNLDLKQLQQRFSGKVFDRMKEMFNVIPMKGESWRGKR